jgi:hypothetical protein
MRTVPNRECSNRLEHPDLALADTDARQYQAASEYRRNRVDFNYTSDHAWLLENLPRVDEFDLVYPHSTDSVYVRWISQARPIPFYLDSTQPGTFFVARSKRGLAQWFANVVDRPHRSDRQWLTIGRRDNAEAYKRDGVYAG